MALMPSQLSGARACSRHCSHQTSSAALTSADIPQHGQSITAATHLSQSILNNVETRNLVPKPSVINCLIASHVSGLSRENSVITHQSLNQSHHTKSHVSIETKYGSDTCIHNAHASLPVSKYVPGLLDKEPNLECTELGDPNLVCSPLGALTQVHHSESTRERAPHKVHHIECMTYHMVSAISQVKNRSSMRSSKTAQFPLRLHIPCAHSLVVAARERHSPIRRDLPALCQREIALYATP